nr:IS30 family transposase [Suttonella indologenes]
MSREIKRNTGKRAYRPLQAQEMTEDRKKQNAYQLSDFAKAYINHLIERKYSPEQMTGHLKRLGWQHVPSHESIYRYIYADKKSGADLYRHLRSQKTYRKRGFKAHDRRGHIPNRVDISERPKMVEQRSRLGDYEGDTVIGHKHKGALVTLVERTTREVKLKALKHRKAEQVAQACIEILNAEKVCTITFDNGKEFSRHEQIAEALNAEIFFARPYHSWERGSNENLNGLIRQFLPKSVRLDNLCAEYIKEIEDNLNNRPRKVLGFMTPLEVKASFGCVALHT